jgi:hypothetical protein
MPLKEIFADGDVLVGDDALAWLVLQDGIDEHGRMAIADPIQQDGDIEARHVGV